MNQCWLLKFNSKILQNVQYFLTNTKKQLHIHIRKFSYLKWYVSNVKDVRQHHSYELKSAQRDTNLRAGCTKAAQMLKQAEPHCCKVNGNGKVILDTHPESDQHQIQTCSRGSPPAPTHQIWWWSINPFLRYLADKNIAHTHTDRHTDRQTDRQTHADDHKTLRPTARR